MVNENMVPVSTQLRYYGFDYTQMYLGTRSCLYRQTYQGKTMGFEVFIITPQPEILIKGIVYPARERWPKDEDFGKTEWSFFSHDEAFTKMKLVSLSAIQNPKCTRKLPKALCPIRRRGKQIFSRKEVQGWKKSRTKTCASEIMAERMANQLKRRNER